MPKQIGINNFFQSSNSASLAPNTINWDDTFLINTEDNEIDSEQSENFQPRNKKLRFDEDQFDSILVEKYHPPQASSFQVRKKYLQMGISNKTESVCTTGLLGGTFFIMI